MIFINVLTVIIGQRSVINSCRFITRIVFNMLPARSSAGKTAMWVLNVAVIITLTVATVEAIAQIELFNRVNISNKATAAILWNLCAFMPMWLGLRLKNKTLHIIFSISDIKTFHVRHKPCFALF